MLNQQIVDPHKTSEISKLLKNKKLIINNSHYFIAYNKFLTAALINGGARRDRTADLLRARQALSQLSYGPLVCH